MQVHSLHHLCAKPPRTGDITHVFIDPWILSSSDPRHELFTKFKNYNDKHQLNIQFLYYKYLFMRIRQFPAPHQMDFSIFNTKIQEMGMKARTVLRRIQTGTNIRKMLFCECALLFLFLVLLLSVFLLGL